MRTDTTRTDSRALVPAAAPVPERAPSGPPGGPSGGPSGGPPTWLLGGLAAGWLMAAGLLLFWPGATAIQRLRALDGGICAQLPTHSFFPAGQQLPLCARNTGIYLGFFSVVLLLGAMGRLRAMRLPSRGALVALGLGVLLMAEDGFNSLFRDLRLPYLYEPQNLLRLATGLAAGTAIAGVMVPITNSMIWREENHLRSFGSLGQLATVLPLLSVAWLAIGSQAAFLLYPIALLSSAGVVLAVTLVNLVVMLALTNRIGRYDRWRALLPVCSVAIALALLELMALFMLKIQVMHLLTA